MGSDRVYGAGAAEVIGQRKVEIKKFFARRDALMYEAEAPRYFPLRGGYS